MMVQILSPIGYLPGSGLDVLRICSGEQHRRPRAQLRDNQPVQLLAEQALGALDAQRPLQHDDHAAVFDLVH